MQSKQVEQTNIVAISHILEFLSDHPNELIFGALLMDFYDGSVRIVTPDTDAETRRAMEDAILALAGNIQARQHGEDIPDGR